MAGSLLILGQGLAGTLLGFACERAGVAFEIVDAGHEGAASRVGAGIINPITGQRIVKSWRVDELRPPAVETYGAAEALLGVALKREMRVRRLFKDDKERRVFAQKRATGELAPYVREADEDGFWIEDALRIDTAALIASARVRWLRAGRLVEARMGVGEALARAEHVVVCTGADGDAHRAWGGAPCVCATGEILRVGVEGLEPNVILNRGHWLLPTAAGEALVGATYLRGEGAVSATEAARVELERSAQAILGARAFEVRGQERGLRVTTPDRAPIAGWVPGSGGRLGVFNGLGSKGALLAPWIAEMWLRALVAGEGFDPAVDVGRFAMEFT